MTLLQIMWVLPSNRTVCSRQLLSITDQPQRLGMMTLLGQHGQRLDYRRGIDLIRRAAETADENAPQGAYVGCRI